jgi:hypothetical protein
VEVELAGGVESVSGGPTVASRLGALRQIFQQVSGKSSSKMAADLPAKWRQNFHF